MNDIISLWIQKNFMAKCKERLETKTEIISGPQKSYGDNQGVTRDMSISLDLFPAGGGSGGLFLRNSVLLILDVVSYHFPSYFNRKNQSLFVNKSLLPTGDQGSLRGDRFFFILHATENYSL